MFNPPLTNDKLDNHVNCSLQLNAYSIRELGIPIITPSSKTIPIQRYRKNQLKAASVARAFSSLIMIVLQ
jgi:hypothetical protein